MKKMNKRIANIMKAMKNAKDYECKVIWNNKLHQLLELKTRRANERLEHHARMVH